MSKKIFSVILAAVLAVSMLFCFAACGGSGNTEEAPDTSVTSEQSEELMGSVQSESEDADEGGEAKESTDEAEASETEGVFSGETSEAESTEE